MKKTVIFGNRKSLFVTFVVTKNHLKRRGILLPIIGHEDHPFWENCCSYMRTL